MKSARPADRLVYGLTILAMVLIAGPRVIDLVTTGHLSAGGWVLLVGPAFVLVVSAWRWSRTTSRAPTSTS